MSIEQVCLYVCTGYVCLEMGLRAARMLAPRLRSRHPGYSVKVRLGISLAPLAGQPHDAGCHLYPHYRACLTFLCKAQGYPPYEPQFEVEVDPALDPQQYVLSLAGAEVGRGRLQPNRFLVSGKLSGQVEVLHPVTGADACWLTEEDLPLAWAAKLPHETPLEAMCHHLRLALVQNMHLVFYSTYCHAVLDQALRQHPGLLSYSHLFRKHRDELPEIMRQSVRLGASLADRELYFACLGRGLRASLNNREISRQLRERCPAGTPATPNQAPRVAASLLHGFLTKGGYLDSNDLPLDVEALGHSVLGCSEVERSELLQAYRLIHCRTELSHDRSELKELCNEPHKLRHLPPNDKLASVLLALPADQGRSVLSGLAARLPHPRMARVVGSMTRLAVFLHLYGDDVEASRESILREPVEEFLDFRQSGFVGPPTRVLGHESLTAEEFQNLTYQVERLYFPVLHWRTELEGACRHVPEAVEELVRWHDSSASRPNRSQRAAMALKTIVQPLQSLLLEELRARGCPLDEDRSPNLTEALACELELTSRLGTRLA